MAYDIEERDHREQRGQAGQDHDGGLRHRGDGTRLRERAGHDKVSAHAPAGHQATLRARVGPAALHARVRISTRGLLAVTALVAGTLLSTAVIVAVATRKLPQGAMPARMKRSRW